MNNVYYLNLDLVPYEQAGDLQKQLVALKKEREFSDFLILLEHPPVYTIGSIQRFVPVRGLTVR
jgi:lipoate-protein ligase B